MLLFIFFFLLLYGGLNLYVYTTIVAGLGFHSLPIAVALILLVLSPIVLRMAEECAPRWIATTIAWGGYNWMGVSFLFATVALVMDGVQVFVPRISQTTALMVVSTIIVLLCIYGFLELRCVRIRFLKLRSPKLSFSKDQPFRMVQISDVHLGYGTLPGQLRGVVEKVRSLKPDLLVSSGDLFDTDLKHLGRYVERLKSLEPGAGKLAVPGNHEVYAGLEKANDLTQQSGFQILKNEPVQVSDNFFVAGVDDPEALGETSTQAAEAQAFSTIPEGAFVVLLKHRPQISRENLDAFGLQLSGHTRGGQIFPFIFMTRLQYKARHGLTKLAETTYLYLSRGTGSWGPQMRVFAPPEITVFDMEQGSSFEVAFQSNQKVVER